MTSSTVSATSTLYKSDAKYFGGARPEMVQLLPRAAQRILDVGCSNGTFGKNLKSRAPLEVWGVDSNPVAIEEAKKVIDKALCFDLTVSLDQLPEGYFDVVYFNDVLEHLPDPYTLLEKIHTKLSPNGLIIASIPNIRFFRVLTDLLLKKDFKYREDGVMDITHLRFFTRKSMIRMFEQAGYKVDFMSPINKTKSFRPWLTLILTLGLVGTDIFYPQFAIVASRK